ncbi:UV damage endonuclease UvsE [Peribacillus muralis]|uniref:UV DNA damage endonuclease n=1 Tax=Peribacillus muralis TaxID=264697 RepID=A0A1B3XVL5_9BACI|nr:UV DNA damage repair endonuclease UvsE [Peribacillus muralis]AOH57231.1 UV damage endonuclease UvsE [Peribacillus muralis]
MKIRFGFVSNATCLWEASPAKTLTFKRYGELGPETGMERLLSVTRQNIENTLRVLQYNTAHQIEIYRMSSSIVPLATHPDVEWDFVTPFKKEWKQLGEWVTAHNMRVSFHPNQFTLFTSPKPGITHNAVKDMEFHYNMFDAMGIADSSFINIHVGGAYGDKESALVRVHDNLKRLPEHVKARMTFENDDKTYTTSETLRVCKREGIPLVFDYHHHLANLSDEPLNELLTEVIATWSHAGAVPKIHISSPKSPGAFRSHADYIDLDFIMPLFKALRDIGQDVDFMIEAKMKDRAMLQLIEDISKVRGVKRVSGGSIEC